MKKLIFLLTLALSLVFTSCGDRHKAKSLVKDFLNENLENEDCTEECYFFMGKGVRIVLKS